MCRPPEAKAAFAIGCRATPWLRGRSRQARALAPPDSTFRCAYVAAHSQVKARWVLTVPRTAGGDRGGSGRLRGHVVSEAAGPVPAAEGEGLEPMVADGWLLPCDSCEEDEGLLECEGCARRLCPDCWGGDERFCEECTGEALQRPVETVDASETYL